MEASKALRNYSPHTEPGHERREVRRATEEVKENREKERTEVHERNPEDKEDPEKKQDQQLFLSAQSLSLSVMALFF